MSGQNTDIGFERRCRLESARRTGAARECRGEVFIPAHVDLSVARIDGLYLSIGIQDDAALAIGAKTSITAGIGPVRAVLDRVGMPVRSPSLNAAATSARPISISASSRHQASGCRWKRKGCSPAAASCSTTRRRGIYAGVMQLSLHEQITLTAFGLIATRMPDGSRGYSLLIFITAEDFRPIPLGLGFTLQGIGGMVAVHRTFDENVLREGLKNDTLSRCCSRAIRSPMRRPSSARSPAAFPARRGSYLLGLLARISWFTPTLIQMDLALILRVRRARAAAGARARQRALPTRDNDLVRLNARCAGRARLRPGHRLGRRRAGRLAPRAQVRAHRGDGDARALEPGPRPGFVLAVGGFNPRFAPPAGVPPLARVAIALSSGDNPRLTCEAYFALTSNTVQFGARAALYAAAYGFSVQGDIGFDVLLQIAPLHFIADFHASVQLKHGSSNLFKVSVTGTLEGPRPLRVSGKATFEIFWCDFSVRFDETLIDGEPPPPPLGVDVLAALKGRWPPRRTGPRSCRPSARMGWRCRTLAPGTTLILDPLGRLAVKQQVVPLNSGRDIDLYGGAPVIGDRALRARRHA